MHIVRANGDFLPFPELCFMCGKAQCMFSVTGVFLLMRELLIQPRYTNVQAREGYCFERVGRPNERCFVNMLSLIDW